MVKWFKRSGTWMIPMLETRNQQFSANRPFMILHVCFGEWKPKTRPRTSEPEFRIGGSHPGWMTTCLNSTAMKSDRYAKEAIATADIKGRRRKLLCVKVFSVDLTKCLSWHREMPEISHLNDFPNAEKGERERSTDYDACIRWTNKNSCQRYDSTKRRCFPNHGTSRL